MENKLKPCPFCKPEDECQGALIVSDDRRWAWAEFACGARGPERRTEKEAINAWNTRTVEDALRARVEELRRLARDVVESFRRSNTGWAADKLQAVIDKHKGEE